MNRLASLSKQLRRSILRHRRVLAALATAGAVAAGLQATSSPPPPKSWVLTAARDIPGGSVVGAADVHLTAFDPRSVPTGVLDSRQQVVGRTTATPVRSGEPITDVRLVSGSMLEGYPGLVAAPIRIGDPGAVALLRIGDRVDVLAADPNGAEEARVVAHDVAVISIPRDAEGGTSMVSGGLVVVAISDATAKTLAAAGVANYLSILINH